jgi:HD superfamily phosphodiesterase
MITTGSMQRVNKLLSNPDYLSYLQNNYETEKERIFCSHGFEHLLATARLTWLFLLEDGNPYISREIAYAAGLLHDIGRWLEYCDGGDHALLSSRLALPVLNNAGFSRAESRLISQAIEEHRIPDHSISCRSALSAALYKADNHSRICFSCSAAQECNKLDKQPHKTGLEY